MRKDGATFMLVPGHKDERIESVVEVEEGHEVVEKQHPDVAGLARKLNPRTA